MRGRVSWLVVEAVLSMHGCGGDDDAQGDGSCAGACQSGGTDGNQAGTFDNPQVESGTGGEAGTSAGAGGKVPPTTCADTRVHASKVPPTVILVIDQSSSMDDNFGGAGSRWDVLRDFLLGQPDGLIASLQSQVSFGLALYSAESGGQNPDPIGECPQVTTVTPSLDNFDAIQAIYGSADTIEDTPTGDSIDRIVEDLGLADPDADPNPVVFILATDGEPDQCEQLDPQEGQGEAIAAVENAYKLGIRTFVISVGDDIGEEHQQDIANAGLGLGPGGDAQYWRAGDDQTLREALLDIVGGQLTCEVQLQGAVESGDPCLGSVTLNGVELGCNQDDGWELSTPHTIRLLGQACDELKTKDDVLLEVAFPCDVGVVF